MNYLHIQETNLYLRQNLVKFCGVHNIPVNGDCMVRRPNWSPDQIGRPSMVAQWSPDYYGRPPALFHRPNGGGKGRAAIYLGARPFWAPAQNGRSGLFKTANYCYRNKFDFFVF